jgi:cytochrome c peroxidase
VRLEQVPAVHGAVGEAEPAVADAVRRRLPARCAITGVMNVEASLMRNKRSSAGAWMASALVAVARFASAAPAVPPIPETGPLAAPRSQSQVGFPKEQTIAAIPADNQQTPDKIALGEKLFFDGRLSVDGTVACSSCHDPARAFTDGRPGSIGVRGQVGQRNAPTVMNALYNKFQFWDGRVRTLEEQAALPITNPIEMGQPSLDAAVAAIAAIPEYQKAFQKVFSNKPNGPDLLRALASYERTLLSFDSPFDRFMNGDKSAIDDAAKRGWTLFNGQARCNLCHAVSQTLPNLTNFNDNDFHNIGIGIIRHHVVPLARQAEARVKADPKSIDNAALQSELTVLGRFLVTRKESDTASFKTPTLRNLLLTGPYFHDGSQATLWDVVDHYNKGDGIANPWLDQDMQPLALQENQIDDLVAFLAALTSHEYEKPAALELERQRALSKTTRPQRDTKRAFGPKPVQPKPPPL